ncbi:hypothetical protein THIAE_09665 [Thiomicrospira aerophila AL3]|uniref:Uncharacterized protein n=1 Tax=Thiomicrospira aerophila AL3 TaxID=717772 RepID=W0DUW7_9GAMM|nr:helix-turn-helix transcriptional regulator [Thiomicrospira aerophila]AHF02395.1 hypothetical protein THIAE_09665 [Thiomicrospira aerophila AL3]
MDKGVAVIRKELIAWATNITDVQKDISMVTGVSQSQISKILSGNFKTVSPNVKKICEYANIQIYSNDRVQLSQELKEALMDLWDGSKESEKALVKTLKNMKSLIAHCYDRV